VNEWFCDGYDEEAERGCAKRPTYRLRARDANETIWERRFCREHVNALWQTTAYLIEAMDRPWQADGWMWLDLLG
jgi:hypothetical protein